MKRHLILLAVIAFTGGCTTTEQANTSLSTKYAGRLADEFFLQHGPPQSSYAMQDGRTMFLWSERAMDFSTPATATSTVTMVGNTGFVNTVNNPGTSVTVQCEVRIIAGKDGKIQDIRAQNDSIGLWQMSRCNEVFGQ